MHLQNKSADPEVRGDRRVVGVRHLVWSGSLVKRKILKPVWRGGAKLEFGAVRYNSAMREDGGVCEDGVADRFKLWRI